MYTKIICPVDFSEASINAVEYASKIAQGMNAGLKLLHVKKLMPEIIPALHEPSGIKTAAASVEKLEDMCAQVNKTFHISCTYEVATAHGSLEKIIANEALEGSLVVMGTNGIDDWFQYFFGTHTYNVIMKAERPILVIPESVTYGTIKKIVFAWDYSIKDMVFFNRLEGLLDAFNPEITFLHVAHHETAVSNDLFRALQEEVTENFSKNRKLNFKKAYADDISQALVEYMNTSGADVLALVHAERGFIKSFAGHPVLKKLTQASPFPLLILNNKDKQHE